MDDATGELTSFYVQNKIKELAGMGFSFVFDKKVSTDAFVLEENRAWLDEIIALSQNGAVDVTAMVTFQSQTNGILKYLTENNYRSSFFLHTAATTADLFDIALGIGDWLRSTGKMLMCVAPNNHVGANGSAFVQKFRDTYMQEPSPYSGTAYDCAFTLALAMLYSGEEVPSAPGVKQNVPKFKQEQRTADEVQVGIGREEFSRAAQLIREGKRVNFVGSSGSVLFDENGDRPRQGMCILGPNATLNAWENKECFDENFQKI